MVTTATTEPAGSKPLPATVKVWDLFVRIFHWSLVVLVTIAILTGDQVEWVHLWAGYVIATFVAMRIIWGFVGSENGQFSSFVTGPRAVITFLKQSAQLRAPRYLGHNPAGGWMVIAMLVVLSALCVTGIAMTTDAYWGSKTLEEIHETLANILLGLIALHILGVIVASLEHAENLVWAMITGRKRAH